MTYEEYRQEMVNRGYTSYQSNSCDEIVYLLVKAFDIEVSKARKLVLDVLKETK